MPGTWKTVRVFISSTFRDMHAERDWLVKRVFPALRERLEAHCIHLIDIDLRWGVTKEQADNDEVLDICLKQIDECRPFFLGILGERYGWVSTHVPDRVFSTWCWIRHHTGKSVTELEILHGVLNSPAMYRRAFFCFRDPAFLADVPPEQRGDLRAERPKHKRKPDALKQAIRPCGLQLLENYPCRYTGLSGNRARGVHLEGLEEFGRRIQDWLWQSIRDEYQLPEQPVATGPAVDPLADEQGHHERFMESRLRVYIGRDHLQQTLSDFANSADEVPCLVTGPSGSGKSAALAKFAVEYAARHAGTLVIGHFVGASPASTSLRSTLGRLCSLLKHAFNLADDIPPDTDPLIATFRQFVAAVPADRRVVIVLDALDQMDEADNAQRLAWLPWKFPPHVKLIASCIADPGRDEPVLQTFAYREHRRFAVEPLTTRERTEIVQAVPALSAKTLDGRQISLLLENQATTNPLFLLVALEELRGFGSYERLNRRIEQLPRHGDTVTALFRQVIERLEAEFQPEAVRSVLTLLASARRGLSDRELLDLVEGHSVAVGQSTSDLFPVLRQLRPYLQQRDALWNFFHRNLDKAVREHYLPTDDARSAAHARLASYFARPDYFLDSLDELRARAKRLPATTRPANVRKVDELPYQLVEVARLSGKGDPMSPHWDAVVGLLTDLHFLEAKAEAGLVFQLLGDFATILSSLPPTRPQRRILQLLNDALRRDVSFIARHPTTLFQCFWNSCWWHDCDEAADHYDLAASEAPGGRFPWQAEGERLCDLLEKWRGEKGRELPGWPWLRSLRPSPMHLGERKHWLLEMRDWATKVAFSPDARRILHLSVSAPIRIWDVQTSQELVTLHNTEGASAATFSPDGQRVAVGSGSTGSGKGRMQLFHAASGQEYLSWQAAPGWIHVLAFSPDGRRIGSGNDDGFRIWDANSGHCLQEVNTGGNVHHLAFSPDGKKVATGGWLAVWDADTGARLWQAEGQGWGGWGLAFLPGGWLVAANIDQVMIWDAETGVQVAPLPEQDECFALAGTPDGRILIANGHGAVRVWDAQTRRLLLQLPGDGHGRIHPSNDEDLAFSADGQFIASVPGDLLIRSCDPEESCLSLQLRWLNHASPAVTPVPGGGHFLTSNYNDGRVLLWDIRKATPIRSWDHRMQIRCLAASPDAKWAVGGGEGSGEDPDPDLPDYPRIKGWNLDGTMTWSFGGEMTFTLQGHKERVNCLTFSPDGGWIASGSHDRTVRLWNLEEELSWREGSQFRRTLKGHRAPVAELLFSPDSRTIASLGEDSKAILWSVDTGEALLEKRIAAWAFSPDGRWFGALTGKGNVRVWRTDNGEEAVLLPQSLLGEIVGKEPSFRHNELVFSPNGQRIALHGDHAMIAVWDWQNQKQVCRPTTVGDWAGDLRFSPDGRFLLCLPKAEREGQLLVMDVERDTVLSSAEAESLNFAEAGLPPWIAFRCDDGRTTAIASTRGGGPIAWFPQRLEPLGLVGGDFWVGRSLGSYLCLVALESADAETSTEGSDGVTAPAPNE